MSGESKEQKFPREIAKGDTVFYNKNGLGGDKGWKATVVRVHQHPGDPAYYDIHIVRPNNPNQPNLQTIGKYIQGDAPIKKGDTVHYIKLGLHLKATVVRVILGAGEPYYEIKIDAEIQTVREHLQEQQWVFYFPKNAEMRKYLYKILEKASNRNVDYWRKLVHRIDDNEEILNNREDDPYIFYYPSRCLFSTTSDADYLQEWSTKLSRIYPEYKEGDPKTKKPKRRSALSRAMEGTFVGFKLKY